MSTLSTCPECANHGYVPEPFEGKTLIPCPKCHGEPEPSDLVQFSWIIATLTQHAKQMKTGALHCGFSKAIGVLHTEYAKKRDLETMARMAEQSDLAAKYEELEVA